MEVLLSRHVTGGRGRGALPDVTGDNGIGVDLQMPLAIGCAQRKGIATHVADTPGDLDELRAVHRPGRFAGATW